MHVLGRQEYVAEQERTTVMGKASPLLNKRVSAEQVKWHSQEEAALCEGQVYI